ncbi:MAG: heavy-metal-associated domain-containing protein [Deltaproteobacteria bacterium]|nr:heavy-metal-associated domain-containing protein [Deltaproteobacteria bacterium]
MKLIDTFVIVFLFAFGVASTAIAAETPTKADDTASTKSCDMKIEGMTCGSCEAHVKDAVKDLSLSAEIDVKAGTGKIAYAEGKTTCFELAKKINDAGYKTTVVK